MKAFAQLLMLLIFNFSLLTAQQDTADVKQEFFFPKYSVGITPSAILDQFSAIQTSVDIRVADRIAVVSEFAFINPSLPVDGSYMFRSKLGIQRIYEQNNRGFSTMGCNALLRRSSEQPIADWIGSLLDGERSNSGEYVLRAVEFTNSFHYFLWKRCKLELGYGVGLGMLNSRLSLVTSLHVNVAYCFGTM